MTKYESFSQVSFEKFYSGEKQIGIICLQKFYPLFGIVSGQTIMLRRPVGRLYADLEYSSDNGITWSKLPRGRNI